MDTTDFNSYFKGRKYIITGGSSGIGYEVAKMLSILGAKLILIGRDTHKLERIRLDLERPYDHLVVELDLFNTDNVRLVINKIHDEVGSLSGLVYSSGISPIMPLRTIKYENLDKTMRVNFYSFVEMVKHYSNRKYSNKGSIVAISSTASAMPEKGQTIYSSSKAALEASVKCMAIELSERNIRINSVLPGIIKTEMTERFAKNNSNKFLDLQAKKQLFGLGKPSDIANFVVFLLSDMSVFCTGRSYFADGGRIL